MNIKLLAGGSVCFLFAAAAFGQNGDKAKAEQTLHIDIPVTLEKANVVFDVGRAAFNGDAPFFLGDLNLLVSDYAGGRTKGHTVAVFHGDAAYMVLNDDSYNMNRHVKTGNPYAKAIADLMRQGMQIELCGATAAANHWANANLLPGVQVNTNAMVRVTQLEQEGYFLIYQ